VAKNISRLLNLEKIQENIAFLEHETHAHIHLDLIVGLPGESLESFGKNLNTLAAMSSCEIQIGILKKLSGTHISRHDNTFGMVYSDMPPYDILKNNLLDFEEIQIMKRFARFWDLYYNSGNFKKSLPLLYANESLFENFYAFSLWIFSQTKATYKISLERQTQLLFEYLLEVKKLPHAMIARPLIEDIMLLKGRALPSYLKAYANLQEITQQEGKSFNKRQSKTK
jgi:radical SAM superfamily enzyme YgiQ (UPF0313 family)